MKTELIKVVNDIEYYGLEYDSLAQALDCNLGSNSTIVELYVNTENGRIKFAGVELDKMLEFYASNSSKLSDYTDNVLLMKMRIGARYSRR